MSELKKIGQETAKAQAKQEAKKNQPDVSGTVGLTLVWLAVIVLPFMLHADIIGWLALAVAVILLVAGIFWKPLRSGMSNALVGLVPLWGIVARFDRVNTCSKLRRAEIYTDEDKTKTIPATTYKRDGDTFVRFDGGGESGMNPDHLRELLTQNARVWRCRSFAISEDSANPGLFTVQLSTSPTVKTALDNAVIGILV